MSFKFYVETGNVLFDYIREYLYSNYEKLKTKKNGNMFKDIIKSFGLTNNRQLKYGLSYGTYTIIFNGVKMVIDYNIEGKEHGCMEDVQYYKRIIITSENEQAIKDLVDTVYKEKNKTLSDGKINIFVPESSGDWIKYQEIPKRNLNSIYINEESKTKLLNDIKTFITQEDEYNSFGIPYKRTYLFSGPPGSGKTSFVKAICNELDYNLSILSLNKKFDDGAFMWAMSSIKEKSILLVEDIDCLFNKREKGSNDVQIAFSNFLNVLDGVLYKHGCIMFLTTNHIEKLDHALLRIGRVDYILEFDLPKRTEVKKLFFDIIGKDESNLEKEIDKELNKELDKELEKELDKQFNEFYDNIRSKNLPMAAIVNYLFLNKKSWKENINELINTNNFIKKALKTDVDKSLYS